MKILSVNGSPHKSKGNTHMITRAFLEGVIDAGATVEEVFLQGLNINYCLACYTCWIKTPGRCVHKDDMNGLLDKVLHSDLLLLSTPLYLDGVSAQAKVFLDRMVAILQAHFTILDDHCRHKIGVSKMPDLFLISSCGFSEMENFESLVDTMKRACLNLYMEYKGELLRQGAHFLRLKDIYPSEIKVVLQAARRAGQELIEKGEVSRETAEKVALPFCKKEEFVRQTNVMWDEIIEKFRPRED